MQCSIALQKIAQASFVRLRTDPSSGSGQAGAPRAPIGAQAAVEIRDRQGARRSRPSCACYKMGICHAPCRKMRPGNRARNFCSGRVRSRRPGTLSSILPRKRWRKQTRKATFISCHIPGNGEMLVLHMCAETRRIVPSRAPARFRSMLGPCGTRALVLGGGADNLQVRHI